MSKCLLTLLVVLFGCQKPQTRVIDSGIPPALPPGQRVEIPDAPPSRPGFVPFANVENDLLVAINPLPTAEAQNTRVGSLCDKYNEGRDITDDKKALVKAMNSISLERQVGNGRWVGDAGCAFVFDQRRFSLTPNEWRAIELAEPLKFESFTTRGILLKQLTQTRRPWVQADTLIQTVLQAGRTADPQINDVYYNLLGIPDREFEFLDQFLGCNIQQLFDDEDGERLFMKGIRQSAIALGKNRSYWFAECDEGFAAGTYDVDNTGGVARNLSVNPFPVEARTNNTLQHDGREIIGVLPNGFPVWWLSDGQGNRQSEAPVNLVADNVRANIDPTIRVGFSCDGCHVNMHKDNGDDYLAGQIRGNPVFDARERQLGEFLFGRGDGLRAKMREAMADHARVMNSIGIDIRDEEPINQLTDTIRLEMDLVQVASKFHLTPEEFTSLLPSSAGGRAIIGQLLNGDPVNFDELIDSLQFVLVDLNIFRDPIGGLVATFGDDAHEYVKPDVRTKDDPMWPVGGK
jgi:hypothetical protein